jgi:hypothetical protein
MTIQPQTNRTYDAEIDATLSLLAQAKPVDGFEQRLQLRLAEAHPKPTHPSWFARMLAGSAPRRRAYAASLAAAIVLLTGALVYHSSHVPPNQTAIMPRPALHAGFGAAAAMRVTPPTMKPALPLHGHRHARAHIGRVENGREVDGHRKQLPDGVAVPKSPVPEQASQP